MPACLGPDCSSLSYPFHLCCCADCAAQLHPRGFACCPVPPAGQFPLEDSKRLCIYSLETALSKLPPGGEQILGVIDLRGMSLANIDMVFVAFMVDAFFVYYPRR